VHSSRFVPPYTLLAVAILAPALATTVACTTPPQSAAAVARVVVDDALDTTVVPAVPVRVVSLNPASTEMIFAIGKGAALVGRTRWDTYPESARTVPDLGDGMRPNVEAVLAVRPDLVIVYESRENLAARDALRRSGIPVIAQRTDRVADFARTVMVLGRVFDDTARATAVRDSVLASLERAHELTRSASRPRVFWPLWANPPIAAGGGSFLTELLDAAGATNVYGELVSPSPTVTMEDVLRRNPDVVLVTPQGAARIGADPRWRVLPAVRLGRVIVYDTMLVSRPAVRLGEAALYLAKLLHPDLTTLFDSTRTP
jgi:iron complex transport system substrate-binding protein